MKRPVLYIMLLFVPLLSWGQELDCRVEINSDQVQGTNTSIFETLKEAITEYVNDRKWTTAQLSTVERIQCSMLFTVKDYADNRFTCELQVQSRRPVYNSSYTTTLFNFKDDKVEFDYQEFEPLVFSEQTMESNLTAIINYYVYIILGIDFDSFSPRGGAPFFEMARQVVTMGQSSMESGWKAFEDTRNRHALLSAFVEQSTIGFRDLWYVYHRNGLDEMALSVDKSRAKITQSLEQLKQIYEAAPMSVLIPLFKDAKLDELVNIYSKAPSTEKEAVYEILINMYPTDSQTIEKIRQTER